MVSIYHFWRQSGDPALPAVQLAKRLSFADFVVEFVAINPGRRALRNALYVNNELPPNVHMIRLEKWREDLDRLNYPWGPRFQLPHLNASEHEPAITYHDGRTIELIRQRYGWIYDAGLYPEPLYLPPGSGNNEQR